MTDAQHEAPAEGAGELDRAIRRMRNQLVGSATFMQLMFGREDVRKALDALEDLRARSSAPEAREEALGNLLAVIHGDGGHRALEVGVEQASAEAEKIVARLLSSAPEAREGEAVAWGCVARLSENTPWEAFPATEIQPDKDGAWSEAITLYTHPAAPSADKLREVLVDLTSWFTKPVQGQSGMVWVIPAGERGADDALNAALAALKAEGGK